MTKGQNRSNSTTTKGVSAYMRHPKFQMGMIDAALGEWTDIWDEGDVWYYERGRQFYALTRQFALKFENRKVASAQTSAFMRAYNARVIL